ncbi:DinB family protein [Aquabacterium humicola]|uniref:DinB family protein n=1 Tax=Aquabacterium humicola TaxID=3237377 RepID=UPI002543642F|nr:DinB family protein [Rubrivivax pictus]
MQPSSCLSAPTDLVAMIPLPLLESVFGHKAWADDALLSRLRDVDAEAHADARHAALRILNHIHVVDRIFAAHLEGRPHGYTATNTSETPTLDALHAAVRETDQGYLALIGALSADALAEPIRFTFTDGDVGCMTRAEMLLHVALHGSNHRGAVGRILTQLGVAPPRDLFTGFLHRQQPQRREAGAAPA